MSQTDSFIDEVTEEVRRDRLFALFRKYGWIGVVGVIALVGGAAWFEWQKAGQRENARAFGDQLMAALQAENPQQMLDAIPAGGTQGALVKLTTAAQALRDGRTDEALAALKTVYGDQTLPRNLREMAGLKAVIVGGDKLPEAERSALLSDLAKPGAPYRLLAVEQQAVAALAAGDKEGAIAKAREILMDAGLIPGLQQRASELIVALGGDPVTPAPAPAAVPAE
ncbi:hypothetical protein [Paenirhodobacter sp.]|uniref:hypothetical protein n=1 Tax=Paenirhodobacter sp. TaxID=1965326 RepID=UPI003B3CB40A